MLERLGSSEFGVSSIEILPGQPGNHDPLIQKKLGIKDAQLARRMYDDAGDKFSISTDGELGSLDGLFAVGCAVATALRCKRRHDKREPAYTQVQYRL